MFDLEAREYMRLAEKAQRREATPYELSLLDSIHSFLRRKKQNWLKEVAS